MRSVQTGLLAALTALALLALAAGAQAATVSVSVDPTSENVPKDRQFTFSAAPGERNDAVMSLHDGRLEVRDRGAGLTAGDGCRAEPDGMVSCSADVDHAEVALGDGDDVLVVASALGNANYDGGPGDDRITGNGAYETYSGGPGADVLEGGRGPDVFFEARGAEPSLEADVYDGGPGHDEITYSGRTTAITVDLLAGTGPDGDRLAAIESLMGGGGDDVILGGEGGGRLNGIGGNDRIEGRGGGDKLYGGEGSDVLLGGAGDDELLADESPVPDGRDRLDAGTGNDLVVAGTSDELSCGPGRDRRLPWTAAALASPADCEELFARTAGADGPNGVSIGAHPRRERSRLALSARCLQARFSGRDLPEPVRAVSCRARIEVRAHGRKPGRLLARSRRVRLAAGGGRIRVAGVRARRVWVVVHADDASARIPLRLR